MPYPLTRFKFNDMMECRTRVRSLFMDDDPATFAEGTQRIVDFFHDELVDDDGQPACALVRFFKTHLYRDLDPESRAFATAMMPAGVDGNAVRCLTLMATKGIEPEWNSRSASKGHKAIPLHSVEMVEQAPMIAQLIKQSGLSIRSVVQPQPGLLLNQADSAYNVFHVPRALGSPHIVAQKEFVVPYGIESVLGFGGILASGDMFAVIMFSKMHISAEVADLFKVVGLNMKITVLSLTGKPLFA